MTTSDLNVTQQQVIGANENNSPVSIKSHGQYISDDLYASEVARGKVIGASLESSFGQLITTGGVTNNVIQPAGMGRTLKVPPVGGVQISLVSTSANDTLLGTGIREIHIHYLDGNLNDANEIVPLNGLTPVTTAATDIRFIQCMHIHSVGDGLARAGNISASNGLDIYSYISTGGVRCNSSARRVPAGKRLVIKSVYGGSASGSAQASTVIRLCLTNIEGHDFTEKAILFPYQAISVQDGGVALPLDMPFVVPTGAIIRFTATTDKRATINAGFNGYYENI